MNTIEQTLTEDEFATAYPLIQNHLDPNAGWYYHEGPGGLFETYGEEFEFVSRQDPATVWTFADGEDRQYVFSGLHYVNRIGYLVSTKPVPPGVSIAVPIEDPSNT